MKPSFCHSARVYLREYCNYSSVHGIQYLGEKRTRFEKIWWSIIITICLSTCVFSICLVYQKWDKSPVIVNFANHGTPIYKIPFPAVTICPESKSKTEKFNYTDIFNKILNDTSITDKEATQFGYMSLICDNRLPKAPFNTSTFSKNIFDVLDDLKPDFGTFDCTYRRRSVDCKKLFKPIMTEEGVCYTFNMLDRSDIFRENVVQFRDYHKFSRDSTQWSLDHGYTRHAGVSTYPRRALLAGAKNGLSLHLVTRVEDLDPLCTDAFQGYKVIIHNPTSIPHPSQEYFRVPLDQNVVAEIKPTMITTSDSVRSYDKNRRRCYFQTERYLQYFKIYNSVNCDVECLANYTLDVCDCVSFSMPRESNTSICGNLKEECTKEAESHLQLKNLENKIEKIGEKKTQKSVEDCDCLPLCSSVSYDSDTSQTDWNWKSARAATQVELPDNIHISSLTIYFKNDDFITSERNELYGPIDFLANFGGLIGLFTGFSVLSLMEIVYFLSVRILCNKCLYGKWSGKSS